MAEINTLLKARHFAAVLLLALDTLSTAWAVDFPHHELEVTLVPEEGRLAARDTVTLPDDTDRLVRFSLHSGLQPRIEGEGELERLGALPGAVPREHFAVRLPAGEKRFTLVYGGVIRHELQAEGGAALRGELSTAGSIDEKGVFLAGSTAWFPDTGAPLVTFRLKATLPAGWEAVSQGRRAAHQASPRGTEVTWEEGHPQNDIYLVAARFTHYLQAGDVSAEVYLRRPDPELARRYLDATGRYIQMYERLIGPYPYAKFALVENFWDTGYGMPSFTLMGPSIIRFPFIIYSSYPHEILHNWWGNGVYVDLSQGNWSEGLTAYLSDHLLKAQRGEAAEYRRGNLQQYTDYVRIARDFPLTAFTARHDSASQAVGYGKTMMFFHMLRLRLGDEVFTKGLQRFYRENRFRPATFTDIRRALEAESGLDLADPFQQWLERAGAPALTVNAASAEQDGKDYRLDLGLAQGQVDPVYRLRIPVAVTLEGAEQAFETTVEMEEKSQRFSMKLPARPLRVDVDPRYDVFRRLHITEVPPALTQLFGAERVLAVVPSAAPEALRSGYQALAQAWQGSGAVAEIRHDDELEALPADRSVWLLGWENRFRDLMAEALEGQDVAVGKNITEVAGQTVARDRQSLVLVARRERGQTGSMAWVATDNPEALPGLARKLPHYGKYSYLLFEGDAPTNILKGTWPVLDSVMSVSLVPDAPRAALPPRPPLIAP